MALCVPCHCVCAPTTPLICSGHPAQPAFAAAIDTALSTAREPEKKALPLITASVEELAAMPIKALKQILQDRNLSTAGLAEKQDLVDMIDSSCRNVTFYAPA